MRSIGMIDLILLSPLTAFEFKYKTVEKVITVSGEKFSLTQQGAQPLARYDVLKDLSRVERTRFGGHVVFVTNDSTYWKKCRGNGSSFSLEDGRKIHGKMAWKSTSNEKSIGSKRVAAIHIRGRYTCEWRDYSKDGQFRYLLFSTQRA
jgi:hypothetical protein